MDLSAALHHFRHQEMNSQVDSQSLDSMIANSKAITHNNNQQQDPKKPRPPESEPQKCPRCDSTNTKFCYYNNYSLSQPRYFCKSCRRYWTKGGTLRNVPVGGGCRRNKRPSSSVSSPSSSSFSATSFLKRAHSHNNEMGNPNHTQNPNPVFQSFGGLGLGFGFDHSIGNANVNEFDGFLGHPQSFLMNSIENQSLCYGLGSSSNEIPFEASGINAMKNESIENKGFWGLNYPWQVINHGDNMGLVNGVSSNADLEPVRANWNGIIGNSAWQGTLLHSSALI